MYIVNKDQVSDYSESDLGSKAYNLMVLSSQGFNVPDLIAIDQKAFQVLARPDFSNSLESLREQIRMVDLDSQFIQELEESLDENKKYAVRSSAIGEDGAEHSFAGQLDSFLNVPFSDVHFCVKEVWASAFSDHAAAYRRSSKIDETEISVAVLIQEMIEADVSGVSFSLNPVTGDRRAVVISAVYGLGEGLVSGKLDADVYTVSPGKEKETIDYNIQAKVEMVVYDKANGKSTTLEPVEIRRQNQSCLSDDQILEIASRTREISRFYLRPQDVEWVLQDGELYILQSRPVTTLSNTPNKKEQKRIWDNSNIVESYSGVTTPLTFSFVQEVYTSVYKQFCQIMGVEKNVIAANASIFQMLGFVKGHIYYNLLNWYKVLSLLPGYSVNSAFMEQMMGVKEKIDLPPDIIQSTRNKYYRVIKLNGLLLWNFCNLRRKIEDFFSLTEQAIAPYQTIDYSTQTLDEIIGHYRSLERSLLSRWHAPLINDFFAMVFFGVLKKLIVKWNIDDKETLQNDLLCGEGGIVSTEPIKSLQSISNAILKKPETTALFKENPPQEILRALPRFDHINDAISVYCTKYGDRCVNELKLETITGKQDKKIIIQLLKSYVLAGPADLHKAEKREQKIRSIAERSVARKLRARVFRKLLFSFVLNHTRKAIRNRENQRFERTRIFAVVRELFTSIGERFYAEGILSDKRDIFYLTKDEVFEFIEGTALETDLKRITAERKRKFAGYEDEKIPDRFVTWGPLYHANSLSEEYAAREALEGESLQGIGCSPGIIEGRVVLVRDPDECPELPGNILVAERTDPGWGALFPLARGVLVERGSLLSHSAIVAREMGIPAIVGVDSLMERLESGDEVVFDGTSGVITILSKAHE